MSARSNAWFWKGTVAAGAFAAVVAGLVLNAGGGSVKADNLDAEARLGLKIAPVPLNLTGKNINLVGLGSYIVNAHADCNGCHTAAPSQTFSPGGNPFFGQMPAKVNPAVYLGGGRDFGTLDPNGLSFHVISRNLTPDKTGLPEGGATFEEFLTRITTGADHDHFHPTCTGAPNAGCIPPPFNGDLLQIMPWAMDANMSKHDLRAIYEYLSAIPCIEGDPGNPTGADTKGTRCK